MDIFSISLTRRYEAILTRTHNLLFPIKKANHPKLFLLCCFRIFYKVLKKRFETAVTNVGWLVVLGLTAL